MGGCARARAGRGGLNPPERPPSLHHRMTPRRAGHSRRPRGDRARHGSRTEAERFDELLAEDDLATPEMDAEEMDAEEMDAAGQDDAAPADTPAAEQAPPNPALERAAREMPAAFAAVYSPAREFDVASKVPGRAPTGWQRFAGATWPLQLLVFAVVLAIGMFFKHWRPWYDPQPLTPPAPPPLAPKPRPYSLTPQVFDWLAELRETQLLTDDLEAQCSEAQRFFRENAVDEFLDLDPWTLPWDQVATLSAFCDRGFFTVEREILIKLLENRLLRGETPHGTLNDAVARLAHSAQERKSRLADLEAAMSLYRRGRGDDIPVSTPATEEAEQAARAALVEKLRLARQQRAALDERIGELNVLLAK